MAKKRDIREATAENLASVLGHSFKGGKLKLVVGKQTHAPGIIYAKNFNKETQTGKIGGVPITPASFIKTCHAKGFVVAYDGKYVRVWSSGFFVKRTGHKTSAKMHHRSGKTFEELKDQAKAMHLRKYTRKKTKKALAASIRRAGKGGSRHGKKHHVKHAGKKAHHKKYKGKGKFAALKGGDEGEE